MKALINNEQMSGKYETFQLVIMNEYDEVVGKLNPCGIWIIGGEGRVDLVGSSGSEMLAYLTEDDKALLKTVSVVDRVQETNESSLYDYKEEGWHWIDYRVMGRQPKLDQQVFLRLLELVNLSSFPIKKSRHPACPF